MLANLVQYWLSHLERMEDIKQRITEPIVIIEQSTQSEILFWNSFFTQTNIVGLKRHVNTGPCRLLHRASWCAPTVIVRLICLSFSGPDYLRGSRVQLVIIDKKGVECLKYVISIPIWRSCLLKHFVNKSKKNFLLINHLYNYHL